MTTLTGMRQMPRLLRAMEAIGGDIAPEAVLERIVRTAAELARARYAALAVLNEDGDGVGRLVREGRDPVPDGDGPLIRMLLDGTRHGPRDRPPAPSWCRSRCTASGSASSR